EMPPAGTGPRSSGSPTSARGSSGGSRASPGSSRASGQSRHLVMSRKAKRIQGSGSGLGSDISRHLGPAPTKRTASGVRGTTRTRGGRRNRSQGDPLAVAAALLEANQSKGGGGIGDAIGSVLGAGKKVAFGALDALDTPRAALLSFASEVGDLIDPGGDG